MGVALQIITPFQYLDTRYVGQSKQARWGWHPRAKFVLQFLSKTTKVWVGANQRHAMTTDNNNGRDSKEPLVLDTDWVDTPNKWIKRTASLIVG